MDEIPHHDWNEQTVWLFRDGYKIRAINKQHDDENHDKCDKCQEFETLLERVLGQLDELDELAGHEKEMHTEFQKKHMELRNELTR